MAEVVSAFFFISLIIFLGFFGNLLFKKTKISDVVLLMLIGLLVGPYFHFIDLPSIDLFKSLSPFFGTIALIILLFEGGMQMNFFKVLKELSKAVAFTVLVFVLTVFFTAIVMFLLGWNLLHGLLLGAIIGGSSSAIVISILKQTSASLNSKNLLTIESALTDALCVIVAIAVGGIIVSNSLNPSQIAQNILGAFSIAAVVGAVFGILWLKLLRDFVALKQFQYVLTIGILFFLYVVVEFAKGNGAIAALVFGIILGNAKEIMQMLRLKETELDIGITIFQNEISFFIRTFFFVYLGIIFELSSVNLYLFGIALALMIAIFTARAIGSKILTLLDSSFKKEQLILSTVSARGLAAAVLATYPLSIGLRINGIETQIIQIVFLVILFSNIATTAGVFAFEKQKTKHAIEVQKIEIPDEEQKVNIPVKLINALKPEFSTLPSCEGKVIKVSSLESDKIRLKGKKKNNEVQQVKLSMNGQNGGNNAN